MRIILTVIFNVVAGMIFLRQTPETYPRRIMAIKIMALKNLGAKDHGAKAHGAKTTFGRVLQSGAKRDFWVNFWVKMKCARVTHASMLQVKPPENSRAFTVSCNWPPSRRIRRSVPRRRSPVSSGVK
jgi:hypothetical protein